MKDYRYCSHNIFDIRLHLVWVTKYRYPILTVKRCLRVRELVRQICEAHEVNILSGVVGVDHVHPYVSLPPQLTPSKLVMRLKGRTSRRIQDESLNLKNNTGGNTSGREDIFVFPLAMLLTT